MVWIVIRIEIVLGLCFYVVLIVLVVVCKYSCVRLVYFVICWSGNEISVYCMWMSCLVGKLFVKFVVFIMYFG